MADVLATCVVEVHRQPRLSSLIRSPLRSSLFPYTTLFRSANGGPGGSKTAITFPCSSHKHLSWLRFLHATASICRPQGGLKDRKSTRLNSSHVAISYAVFCLQKKSTCLLGGRSVNANNRTT